MPTINGFNGIFAPAQWNVVSGGGVLSFNTPTNTILTFTQNVSQSLTKVQTSSSLPVGTLSFNWNLSRSNFSGASYNVNGNTITLASPGTGTVSGSVNIAITGNVLAFNITSNELSNTILEISNFEFEYNDVPCFNEGSKILCFKDNEEVYVPIESIKKGDLVKTYKHDYKRVEIIGNKKIYNFKDSKIENNIYKLSKEKYSELNEDLYLTGFHSILVDNISEEQIQKTKEILKDIYITDDKYRLLTCIDSRSEKIKEEKEYTIYHFALENNDYYMNYGVYANGLLVESSSLRYMKELSGMNC
jgi:hypothetical protein